MRMPQFDERVEQRWVAMVPSEPSDETSPPCVVWDTDWAWVQQNQPEVAQALEPYVEATRVEFTVRPMRLVERLTAETNATVIQADGTLIIDQARYVLWVMQQVTGLPEEVLQALPDAVGRAIWDLIQERSRVVNFPWSRTPFSAPPVSVTPDETPNRRPSTVSKPRRATPTRS